MELQHKNEKWVMSMKKIQIIEFEISGNPYGMEITYINGIHKANAFSITPLPNLSEAVKGMTILRDKVYPVVDLQRKLGFEKISIGPETKFITLNVKGKDVGVLVEEVTDIYRPAEQDIRDAQNITFGKNPFISSLIKANNRFVIVLDAEKLFEDDEILSMNMDKVLEQTQGFEG